MRGITGLLASLALLPLAGCVSVSVGPHVASNDYTGQPRRMFVINSISGAGSPASDNYAAAIKADLARCNVDAMVYRPDGALQNAMGETMRVLRDFNPDTVLNMRRTVRYAGSSAVPDGTYVFTLRDVATRRDIWKATVEIAGGLGRPGDLSQVGGEASRTVVRQMSADGVLKSCTASADRLP